VTSCDANTSPYLPDKFGAQIPLRLSFVRVFSF